jgi:soluble lytic murein transglycosylase-like protein
VVGYIRPNSVYPGLAVQDARHAGINPILFVRQIQVESGFDPGAVSATGAVGIAQFLPSTAASLTPPLDPTDPVTSLAVAAEIMANNVRTYGGNYAKALAAYNVGDKAVQKAITMYGTSWLQHLPTQTITYVDRIMNRS